MSCEGWLAVSDGWWDKPGFQFAHLARGAGVIARQKVTADGRTWQVVGVYGGRAFVRLETYTPRECVAWGRLVASAVTQQVNASTKSTIILPEASRHERRTIKAVRGWNVRKK